MFGFLKTKTKKEKEKNIEEEKKEFACAPGTQIRYAPELIDKLQDDHQLLLQIFGQINTAFSASDYKLVTKRLKEFKTALMDHLLTENVRLYIYLSRSFATDDVNSDLVQGFRTEMNGIAKAVMTFLTRYETIGVDETLAETFSKDLKDIGEALVARIDREENTLYPLYMPSY